MIPGLVDIHFHGCVRHDMCDGTEESIQALADYEAANGVLAICPATMTIPEDQLISSSFWAPFFSLFTKGPSILIPTRSAPFPWMCQT